MRKLTAPVTFAAVALTVGCAQEPITEGSPEEEASAYGPEKGTYVIRNEAPEKGKAPQEIMMSGTEEEKAKQKEGPTPEQKRSHTHGRAKMQWEKIENETGGKDTYHLNCLLYKAHRVEGESEADEKYLASATPEHPLPEVLEDAGYTCTEDEMFALLERELDPALMHREETRENRERG